MALTRVGVECVSFGSSLVLARLVPPAEFGRAAVALIVVALALVITPQGLGAPLVRFPSSPGRSWRRRPSSAWSWAPSSRSAPTRSPVVADPIFGGSTSRLIQLAAPAWLLTALGTVPLALLQRNMDFRRIGSSNVLSLFVGSLVALVAAAAGGLDGPALVVGGLAGAGSMSLCYLAAASPLVIPRPHRRAMREITGFGVPVVLSSVAFTVYRNVDYAILGARLGALPLGLYWRAYQLGVDYQSKITGIMQQIGFPLYSRTDDLDDMRRVRERISRLHATLVIPLLALLIPLAPVVVPLLYGDAWRGASRPTQILAPQG